MKINELTEWDEFDNDSPMADEKLRRSILKKEIKKRKKELQILRKALSHVKDEQSSEYDW